jgi:hypothetical protein
MKHVIEVTVVNGPARIASLFTNLTKAFEAIPALADSLTIEGLGIDSYSTIARKVKEQGQYLASRWEGVHNIIAIKIVKRPLL